MSAWVLDASPLILLGKLGRLEWLPEPTQNYWIPQAVVTEILAGPEDDLTRRWMVGVEAGSHVVPDDEAVEL